ncbi:MAG: pyridoxal-phosphate dependent enzyme [Ignavibacteria bacterium]|nr:pyridoxal-phosphate dependent enzyme [Ignavibacteria bacterium]
MIRLVDLDTIRQAYRRIQPYVHTTPVLTNSSINRLFDANIFFKCENFQKAGAFKARGANNAVILLGRASGRRVVTHSSGNHGQALAFAAATHGFQCTVVMPSTSQTVKVDAIREYGADIVFSENTLDDRLQTLNKVLERTGGILIHPYDNDDVISGQGTAALEMLHQTRRLDAIIAPVGGGGLMSGTAIAARSIYPGIEAFGAEPALANDAFISMQQGVVQPPNPPITIADGLRTALCERTFHYLTQHGVSILTCSEESIRNAQRLLFERMKIVVEASGAVGLAIVSDNREKFRRRRVGVILSGGNCDITSL